MNDQQLYELGKQLSRDIAAGLMAGAAAGASEFAAQMDQIRHENDSDRDTHHTDGLMQLAERIDSRRAELESELSNAKGLRAAAIKREMARLDQAEQEMCRQLESEAEQPKALTAANGDVVSVKAHTRRKRA